MGYLNITKMKQQKQLNKLAAKLYVFCQWPLSKQPGLLMKTFPSLFNNYNCYFTLASVDNYDNNNNNIF